MVVRIAGEGEGEIIRNSRASNRDQGKVGVKQHIEIGCCSRLITNLRVNVEQK